MMTQEERNTLPAIIGRDARGAIVLVATADRDIDADVAADIARILDIPPGTTYYYASKIKRMKKTVRRFKAA